MRVAIVGSRDWPDERSVWEYVHDLPRDTVVVSGGARGVDSMAVDAALDFGLEVKVWPADWNQYGRSAGYIRNKQIVDDCDRLVAFQFNNSRGTQHSIDLARAAGKMVTVIV